MFIANEYLLYTNSTTTGDYIAMEQLLNNWLPIWKAGRKCNYTELSMANMEILYKEMSPIDI